MDDTLYQDVPIFRSRLNFVPLIEAWQRCGEQEDDGFICRTLAKRFSAIPEFLQPIDAYRFLETHKQLIDEGITTIFPVLMQEPAYQALTTPFSNKVIYASAPFRKLFMDEKNNYILPLDLQVEKNIQHARIHLAYKMILQKFYQHPLSGGDQFICAYPEADQDIHRYFEMSWDPQFIHVSACNDIPALPENFQRDCLHVDELVQYEWLQKLLPIDGFIFDGLLPVTIRDVTHRESAQRIRELLETDDVIEEEAAFLNLRSHLRYLLDDETLETGIISFYEYPSLSESAERIFQLSDITRSSIHAFCEKELAHADYFRTDVIQNELFLPALHASAKKYGCITGLYEGEQLCGITGIFTSRVFDHGMISRLQDILPDISHALTRNRNQMQQRVDRVVKDHFTAVHSSVEWKFKETAIGYLSRKRKGITELETIQFHQVFPLYGAIDIRNSSGERNRAAEQDLLQQLRWIKIILLKAFTDYSFPVIEEMISRTEEWITLIDNRLFGAYERQIMDFLRSDASEMMRYLEAEVPGLKKDVAAYHAALDPQLLVLNSHQHELEESTGSINRLIAHRLDQYQMEAQNAFPHYFERFVTDGVECNMYIGPSITLQKKFSLLHLKNLRLWQLKSMACIGQELMELSEKLTVPLPTTQLIFVYDQPISISFRAEERKFDVSGVYDSRYEVIKKRLDKAVIARTSERLTQPDTIAVVYNGLQEEKEYESYFRFLKKQELFEGEPEMLELEDMQGVSGLKAMRMKIAMFQKNNPSPEAATQIRKQE